MTATAGDVGWLGRARTVMVAARLALSAGHTRARALAVADSRALVRSLFISSAVRTDILTELAAPGGISVIDLARRTGIAREDRLEAWLSVGCELGELRFAGGRYRVHGQRSRAIVAGDELLTTHYRSVLDYQTGPYAELADLMAGAPDAGRQDLDRYADEIAQASLAAAPFVAPVVSRVVTARRPRAVLDIGCGSGAYSRVVLDSDPRVTVTGVDLAEDVIAKARADLSAAGHGQRFTLHAANVEAWAKDASARFDLVMLHNNIYYFMREHRPELFRTVRNLLAPGGEILLSTMTTPGSVASAHLHLMLVAQAGTASLPERASLLRDFDQANLHLIAVEQPVPMEPYLVVRAVPKV